MNEATPITVELVELIVAVVAALAAAILIAGKMIRGAINGLRTDMDDRFASLRGDVDKRLDSVVGKFDDLSKDHADHKLHIAENYMSKTSFTAWSATLTDSIQTGMQEIYKRLGRIETRLDGTTKN